MDRPRRHEIIADTRRDLILLSDDHAQEQATSRLSKRRECRLAYLVPPSVDLPPYPFIEIEHTRMLNLQATRAPDKRDRVNPVIPEVDAVIKPAGVSRAKGGTYASADGNPVSSKHVHIRLTLVPELAWTPRQAQGSPDITARRILLDGFQRHDHRHSTRSVFDRFRHHA